MSRGLVKHTMLFHTTEHSIAITVMPSLLDHPSIFNTGAASLNVVATGYIPCTEQALVCFGLIKNNYMGRFHNTP